MLESPRDPLKLLVPGSPAPRQSDLSGMGCKLGIRLQTISSDSDVQSSLGTTEKSHTQVEQLQRAWEKCGLSQLENLHFSQSPDHRGHLQCTEVKALHNRASDTFLGWKTSGHPARTQPLPTQLPLTGTLSYTLSEKCATHLTKWEHTGTKLCPVSQEQQIFPDPHFHALNH